MQNDTIGRFELKNFKFYKSINVNKVNKKYEWY